jgi:hypothetical protein
MAKVSDRKPRITWWADSDNTICVRFTRENGERVEGIFGLCGWQKAPHEENVSFLEAQRRGFISTLRVARPALAKAAPRQRQARQPDPADPCPEGSAKPA